MRNRFFLLLSLLALGCSTGDRADNVDAPTYYQDAKAIFDTKCVTCHIEDGIAPMKLTTYEDAYAYRAVIRHSVESRTMPPWMAAPGHRRYKGDFSLTDADIETVVAWVDGGGVKGTPPGPQTTTVEPAGLPRVDVTLKMPVAYAPSGLTDDYRCFVLDTSNTETIYVTGFDAKPGNAAIVHHLIAYLAYPNGATLAEALDDAAPGEGYPCLGGPGRIGENDYDYTSLGGWAPGGDASVYPEGTGIRVPAGSKIVLQVHYNSTEKNVNPDRTTVQLTTERSVEEEGFIIAWLNPYWLQPLGMLIPPNDPEVVREFEFDLTKLTLEHTPIVEGKPFVVHSAQFHMHRLGKSGLLYIDRMNGEQDVLLEIPRWDFNWQRQYFFEEPVRFNPGDKLGIRCTWDNSATNQPTPGATPTERRWGEGSDDEMCVGFFYTTSN